MEEMRLQGRLHYLFKIAWCDEKVSQDFKDASIVLIYRKKGHCLDCGNYRGKQPLDRFRSLPSIAGKNPNKTLFSCLIKTVADDALPEAQCNVMGLRSVSAS